MPWQVLPLILVAAVPVLAHSPTFNPKTSLSKVTNTNNTKDFPAPGPPKITSFSEISVAARLVV